MHETRNGTKKGPIERKEGDPVVTCWFWSRAKRIAQMAGKRRSTQEDLVEQEIIGFIRHVFTTPKFFKEGKRPWILRDRIKQLKKRWPKIKL